jgi:hypothetical protein
MTSEKIPLPSSQERVYDPINGMQEDRLVNLGINLAREHKLSDLKQSSYPLLARLKQQEELLQATTTDLAFG